MAEPYYQDDWVTLYLGDCLEVIEWLSADVLVTDPPYGIAMRQRLGTATKYSGSRNQTELRGQLAGDLSPAVRDKALALWGSKPAIVFGSWKIARPVEVKHRLIWHKAGAFSGLSQEAFLSQDEEIYVIGSGWRRGGVPLRSVITTSEARHLQVRDIGHPTPKPVQLMEMLIDRCPPGVVSDPFAGSGSTLVAAKAQGRQAIGVEIDERYCEIAANRLAQDAFDFAGTG